MQLNHLSRAGVCLSAALICSPISAQETFRSEIFFLHSNSEFGSLDGNSNVFAGAYFFSPVNTGNGPLAENTFLSRSSAISVVVNNSELSGAFSKSQYDADSSGYGLFFEIRDPSTPNTVLAGLLKNKTDITSPVETNHDTTTTIFALGRYFSDNFHVNLRFFKRQAHDLPAGWDDYYAYSIASKFVKPSSNGSTYNLEVSFDRVYDDYNSIREINNSISVEGDYYLNNYFGIGGGINLDRGDNEDTEGETLTLGTSYFFSSSLGVEIQASRFYPNKSELTKDKSINATIALRF